MIPMIKRQWKLNQTAKIIRSKIERSFYNSQYVKKPDTLGVSFDASEDAKQPTLVKSQDMSGLLQI